MIKALIWDENNYGKLSIDTIKEKYSKGNYRISPHSYQAGIKFSGAMRKCICYVISGDCHYFFDNMSIALSSGQYAELPTGNYILEGNPYRNLELVLVWDLSKLKTALN